MCKKNFKESPLEKSLKDPFCLCNLFKDFLQNLFGFGSHGTYAEEIWEKKV